MLAWAARAACCDMLLRWLLVFILTFTRIQVGRHLWYNAPLQLRGV
jgi:hypothetical protein